MEYRKLVPSKRLRNWHRSTEQYIPLKVYARARSALAHRASVAAKEAAATAWADATCKRVTSQSEEDAQEEAIRRCDLAIGVTHDAEKLAAKAYGAALAKVTL